MSENWEFAGERDQIDRLRFNLIAALALRGGGVYIDVGANRGEYLSEALRLGATSSWAFEANPALADLLKGDFPDSKVVQAAVGRDESTATFFISNFDGLSPLRQRADLPPGGTLKPTKVQVTSLDIALRGVRNIALIKIDVEGMETDVFHGMQQILDESSPVIFFEMGPTSDHEDVASCEEIWKLLERFGYRLLTVDGNHIFSIDEFTEIYSKWPIWNFCAIRKTV